MTQVEIPTAFKRLFEPHRYKVFFGGRGSAKSHSFATALVLMAAQRPMRIVCAREIQNSLRESVKKLIEDKVKTCGLEDVSELLDKETRVGDSKFIYIGMWRNPDAAKSLESADVFWGEEASAFSERSLRVIRPTMRNPGSELWFSYNPEFDHDRVERLFRGEAGPPPDSLVVEVNHDSNPWFGLSPLQAEMEHDYATNPAMARHVWGGGYVTSVEGSYFVADLDRARADGRIGQIPVDPILQKRASWDIGVSDSTAIWISQWVGNEIRFIDYIEGQGQPLAYYVTELRRRGHGDALCILPHDGAQRDVVTAVRFEDHIQAAGFETQLVKNQGKGAAMQRIEAMRRLFPRMSFDEEACRDGLKSLAAYHERRNDQRNVGLGPEHDWASHGADSAGLMAVAYEEPRKGAAKPLKLARFGAV